MKTHNTYWSYQSIARFCSHESAVGESFTIVKAFKVNLKPCGPLFKFQYQTISMFYPVDATLVVITVTKSISLLAKFRFN